MGMWKNFLDVFFDNKTQVTINTANIPSEYSNTLWQYKLALTTVSERIGAILSKCEFKTMVKGEVIYKDNWYLFNFEPNRNQTGCEFIKQLVNELIFSDKHEAVVVIVRSGGKDNLYVATEYECTENDMYDNVYKNVKINTRGYGEDLLLNRTFIGDEVIKIKYLNSGLENIFNEMKIMYKDMMKNVIKAGTYTQKYVLNMDSTAEGDPNFNENLNHLLDEDFRSFIKGENALLPLYNGMKLDRVSNAQEVAQNSSISNDSINKQFKEIMGVVGQPFNIPSSVMLGTYEENDLDDFLTFCIDPLADLISEAINRKYYGKSKVLEGTKIQIDTKKIKHFDILTVSNSINKLISSGVYTINELRKMLDEKPIDSDIGDIHWITRNYAIVGDYVKEQSNYTSGNGVEDEE